MTFDDVNVTARTLRALRELGLTKWSDVAARSPADFLRVVGCGSRSIGELRHLLVRRLGHPLDDAWSSVPFPTAE